MGKRKDELQSLLERTKNANPSSLLEFVANTSNEINKIAASNQNEGDIPAEEHSIATKIRLEIAEKVFAFIDKWEKGNFKPDQNELQYLAIFYQSILNADEIEISEEFKKLEEADKKLIRENITKSKKYRPVLQKLFAKIQPPSSSETPSSSDKPSGISDSQSSPSFSPPPASQASTSKTKPTKPGEGGFPWKIVIPLSLLALVGVGTMVLIPLLNTGKDKAKSNKNRPRKV